METKSRVTRAVALILAFPLLVALQLTLIAIDAPRGLMLFVAVLSWFGGPVLLIVGIVLLWPAGRWGVRPSTLPGRLALGLLAGAASFFLLFLFAVILDIGPDADTFFSNLYLTIPFLLTGACAVGAGLVAGYAILFRHERSLLAVGCVALSLVVAVFTLGEIGGHEEPGGSRARTTPPPFRPTATLGGSPSPATAVSQSPTATTPPTPTPAGNSHTNASVVNVAPGQVRVSFDYANNTDPPGGTVTANTITPLGSDGQPLTGYEPVVKPIARGSGHMDVTFTFTGEQLAALEGFSICFTGPGGAEFGCTTAGYGPN